MRIYLASDHAGFQLKAQLLAYLLESDHDAIDLGPLTLNPDDDYSTYILPLARQVAGESGSFGIVIGLSGQGEAMAANRVKGVRAALYYGGPEELLSLSRAHNDANVLSLGAKFLTSAEAQKALSVWLATPFSGEERHRRRIEELDHD